MNIDIAAVLERFIRYAGLDTQSNPASASCPSTAGQRAFAELLAAELRDMGAADAAVDGNGYMMATIPSTVSKRTPVIGLIAHLDTTPDYCGTNVRPQVFPCYDGGDIVLNRAENIVLRTAEFPEIKQYAGQTIVTAGGTTLLGADDKAGIAAIMSAAAYLLSHGDIPHGVIRIAFTPDEEIGRGADRFDVQKFGADFAYTFDGGQLGELEYENFNAAEAAVHIAGNNIHPGYAKGKMINALNVAAAFHAALPAGERPETTEGRDGFFHLTRLQGTEEQASLYYIIRDFDRASFERRKATLEEIAAGINKAYKTPVARLQLSDQYYNMYEKILPHFSIVEKAINAMQAVGITPVITAARGGTDGARLSFMGLPCPNIFTGGHNPHGKYEFLHAESMLKAAEMILQLVKE
ncbi:MAG: peptidase T [Prevotellaceae bacterium]|jgi:tripeptide aminopeptidase|nr:peptidase T [Prevotellaceae bacterium]